MPDVMAEAAENGDGARRAHTGELSVPRSEPRLVAPEDVEEDEPEEIVQRGIWDLSRDETPERLSVAQRTVFRAYMDDSIARGFVTVNPKFAARLKTVEDELDRQANVKPRSEEDAATTLCSCIHGNEHHEGGTGRCTYGHGTKFGDCTCEAFRPRSSPGEKLRRHDARVDQIIRERQERLAARDVARAVQTPQSKEKPMPESSRTEEIFALVERGMDRSAAIAEKLGISMNTVKRHLDELVDDGRVENIGKTSSSRFYVKGKVPAESERAPLPKRAIASVDGAPAPKRPRAPLKVADVSRAPASSSARFVVNIEGLPVECQTAAEVIELARAYRGA